MSKIRVGFICGKDTDFVEDPGTGPKYSAVGDPSFLDDFPDRWRVDPVSHEYLKDCPPGTTGQAHQDVALAWYIHKTCKDIEVDIITPEDLSLERLASNDPNFTVGYNMVNRAENSGEARSPDARCKDVDPSEGAEGDEAKSPGFQIGCKGRQVEGPGAGFRHS